MRSEDSDAAGRPRRRWVLASLLVFGALVLGVLTAPYLGKLTEVQSNDPGAFLPESAESTTVTELREQFTAARILPTVVVFERTTGLTDADSAAIARTSRQLGGLDLLASEVSKPVPSADGKAARIIVPLSGADPTTAARTVERIQDMVDAGLPAGLAAYVTGPGGYTAAFAEVFSGIDGLLLLVTAGVVAAILILVYRSPLLPIVVLISAGLALSASSAVIYWLADTEVLTLNGQTQGILLILVFGAATDYALLLVARYREELQRHRSVAVAMRRAIRASAEPILASGGTVILSMLCMLVSELASNKSLGPIVSIGIAGALLSSLTFLPATLLLLGRGAFWPGAPVPRKHRKTSYGIFDRIANLVGRRPRRTWIVTALSLLIGVAFVPSFTANGVSQQALFLRDVEAVAGQAVLAEHFAGGTGSPAVIMTERAALPRVLAETSSTAGVAAAAPLPANPADPAAGPKTVRGMVQVTAVLRAPPDSQAAMDTVRTLRAELDSVPGADPKVGGTTAERIDMLAAATHDRNLIIPIVLVVIFIVLALLLRALLAPLLLIGTVVLSFATTLGVGSIVFEHVLDFPGSDPAMPLYAFVFLVALGIDYNIFLMTRAREEAAEMGTARGTLAALRVTGGVITSAGVVLAATFAALSVIPVLFLAQIAFLVAFGVLLDTFIVRSLLVPALAVDVGRFIWWPSQLARPQRQRAAETGPTRHRHS